LVIAMAEDSFVVAESDEGGGKEMTGDGNEGGACNSAPAELNCTPLSKQVSPAMFQNPLSPLCERAFVPSWRALGV